MQIRKWCIPWKNKNNSQDEIMRRDSIYEEVRPPSHRSSSRRSSSTSLNKPSLKRTQTTVKLRKIGSDGRRVFVNLPLPSYCLTSKGTAAYTYVTNKIRTSKYTIISFIPKNLFEQFRRPANLYFLAMAIIQMLPTFGVKSPALTLLPICTVVFITAAKDAFEDFQRHKVDRQYNQNVTHTLMGYQNTNYPKPPMQQGFFSSCLGSNSKGHKHQPEKETGVTTSQEDLTNDVFTRSLSKDIRVGDFILLRNGDSLPADAVLISSSDNEGVCFVETKDLDGETNLKPRNSIQELKHIQSGADCLSDCHFYVEAGAPSPDLYKFSGTLVTLEKSCDKWTEKNKTPVEIENILLRGHVIRNTKWAIAVVLFTGTDTKIMLNSGETPSKRSAMDKQMNQEIFIAFGVLFLLCLICAIMAGVMRSRDIALGTQILFTAQTDSPAYAGFLNFWSSLIIFQNIIPISLYVSIEFVKTFQAYFIWNDLDMWDPHSRKPCVPKTWTLSDDLGQVEYIFSDKTGTLTRNIMEFKECTIGGTRYGDNGFSPESEGARGARLRKEKENNNNPTEDHTEIEKTPQMVNIDEDPLESNDDKQADHQNQEKKKEIIKDYESAIKNIFNPKYSSLSIDHLSFADPQLFKDMKDANVADEDTDDNSHLIKEFFMLLSLCHTVVVEKIGKDGKVIEDEENEEDEDDTRTQPKIADNEKNNTATTSKSEQEKNRLSRLLHYKPGSSKKLFVPGLSRLKKTKKKRKRQSRGEEFDSITDEKDTSDIVDDTVEIQLEYKAESPDEAALVNAAKNAGFTFIKRKGQTLTVDVLGKEHVFELLDVLDFNSDRKRMSVILRRPEPWNDIILYCKGADNVISERLDKNGQQDIKSKTFEDVDAFSNDGLRTLMLSYRVLDEDEYSEWKGEMKEASTASENRAEKIAEAQEKIEVNLKLLGATGIEDKLQEGVPQCIEDLRRAGIKVWVLTGDKLETAINIGYASNLLDVDMKLWTVRGNDDPKKVLDDLVNTCKQLDEIQEKYEQDQDNNDPPSENALIIEGSALVHVFETSESKETFLDIAIRCKSVVCCRVSPLQKALVVQLVRKYHNVVTLAVGDGANDVSMIQVANIGVGIAGQEGVQASMAADYAIAQFRFLHKLLLVQGHWSYARISEMILTFFFKNVFWVFPSLWYQIYSAWSGNIFYDYSFLQLYNIIFTVAPVVILGATDQDLTSPYLKHLPPVYTIGIERKLYTRFRFWIYFFDGVWQSLVVFYAFYFLWIAGNPNANGYTESMLQFSTSVAVTAIVLANMMPGFNTVYWTWWQFFFVGLEILLTFLWVVIYGLFPSVSLFGMAQMVFGAWSFWMTFFLSIVIAFLPRYLITFVCQWWYPNVVAKGRHLELYEKRMRKKKLREETLKEGHSKWNLSYCFPLLRSSKTTQQS
ncbi:hypothetical protein MFLAVUS_001645 [Mucor flavus]|uniref:Phospholipid-transporting ATPase n=1 Tax=Mucor flavus TaxID=439312 RepID=A0ABP9YN38_9FUNG